MVTRTTPVNLLNNLARKHINILHIPVYIKQKKIIHHKLFEDEVTIKHKNNPRYILITDPVILSISRIY